MIWASFIAAGVIPPDLFSSAQQPPIVSSDPVDTPQFWQMIRDRADGLPDLSEWREPGVPYGQKIVFG